MPKTPPTCFKIIFLRTKSASILQLDLEHLHGCGDDDLAHSCTATGQHLPEDRQPAAGDTEAGIKTPRCHCITVRCTPNNNAHPSLLNWWRKKSLAASLMAFSGVTRVRFTAAPAQTMSNIKVWVRTWDFNGWLIQLLVRKGSTEFQST